LIQDCPCNNVNELRAKEGHYIRELGNLNKTIAGRTRHEYRQDNADHPREYNAKYATQYRSTHKEHVQQYQQEYSKTYREQHKEEESEQHKKYYQENKDVIKQRASERHQKNRDAICKRNNAVCTCTCGLTYTYNNRNRHMKAERHKQLIEQQNQAMD
jgi:hypothetical protein